MSQMKRHNKIPEKQLNEVEIGNLPEGKKKKNQNNYSENDLGSRENNEEDAINVYQRPTRTKEQTEMNNTLEGNNRE